MLKRIISSLLLIIVFFTVIPVEVIHEGYGHEDTVCGNPQNPTIEEEHIHCDILDLNYDDYHSDIRFFSCLSKTVPSVFVLYPPSFSGNLYFSSVGLRAPPVI